MGVKVERPSLAGPGTVIDDYPDATSFYYNEVDKILYVQIDNVVSGPKYWITNEAFVAAYPKGGYLRVWLDPVPPHSTAEEDPNDIDITEEGM